MCSMCGVTHRYIQPERIEVNEDQTTWRWSPDGVGYYYYDSLEEAHADHPNGDEAELIYLSESFDEYDRRTERH